MRLIGLILFLFAAEFTFADEKGEIQNEKAETKKRKPAASQVNYFDGTVLAEYDNTNSRWHSIYRFYDKKHKVVCYTLNATSAMACAPSSATE